MNPFFLPEDRPFGDTFPFFKDGVWHLFAMWMPRFGHFTSRDLIHWEKRPETSFGGATGTVLEHDGTYYMFFTGDHQTVHLAMSDDLDHWVLHPDNPILDGDDERYSRQNFRDPFVFYNRAEERWWMLVGTRQMHEPGQRAGCVGLAKSSDLLHWELASPLWAPQIGPHTDCPQLVHENGLWYLIYLQRHTRYRVTKSLDGPWQRTPIRDLGGRWAAANSRPASDGNRWISFPFVATPEQPRDDAPPSYGGALAVPRQWSFHADGRIGLRPPDEVIRAMHGLPAPPHPPLRGAEALIGQWEFPTREKARCTSSSGGTLRLSDSPANFYLETDVTLDQENMAAHILFHTTEDMTRGYQLSVRPRAGLVTLRAISYWDVDVQLEAIPMALPSGCPIKLRLFRHGSILDVFIDDRTTLTHRLYQHQGGHLMLEFRDGTGTFGDLLIRRLSSSGE